MNTKKLISTLMGLGLLISFANVHSMTYGGANKYKRLNIKEAEALKERAETAEAKVSELEGIVISMQKSQDKHAKEIKQFQDRAEKAEAMAREDVAKIKEETGRVQAELQRYKDAYAYATKNCQKWYKGADLPIK